jgi:hypothetical protein
MIISLNIVLIIAFLELIYLIILKIKLNKIKYILNDDIGRVGYYTISHWTIGTSKNPIEFTVFVKELDRYTNGDSEIKLTRVELLICPFKSRESIINEIKLSFSSVMKSSDITWTVSENAIKELRKKKLEAIQKLNK